MDKIRKALDLARLERRQVRAPATPASAPNIAPPAPGFDLPAEPLAVPLSDRPRATTLLGPINYTRTKVFQPPAEVLEGNRILNPLSDEPAIGAYRMLRTQVLQRMDARGWRSIAIFSAGADEGKTTTAINLAVSLANDRQHTVLLVDFDFRRPTLAAKLGLQPEFGSNDAVTGKAVLEDCLYHPEGFDRLVICPAREILADSSEVLAGPRSRAIVGEMRERYPERIIVYDLPPVLSADDALAFAPLVECGLVVTAEGITRRSDLVRTIELLAKTPLVGTVLNRATDAATGS